DTHNYFSYVWRQATVLRFDRSAAVKTFLTARQFLKTTFSWESNDVHSSKLVLVVGRPNYALRYVATSKCGRRRSSDSAKRLARRGRPLHGIRKKPKRQSLETFEYGRRRHTDRHLARTRSLFYRSAIGRPSFQIETDGTEKVFGRAPKLFFAGK